MCDESNTNDKIKTATHKLTVVGDVKITDKITANDIELNKIILNSTFAAPSTMSYVKFTGNSASFGNGFTMDDINNGTKSRDAEILVRNNGVYKSKPISGDVDISNNGEILIKSNQTIITNKHIKSVATMSANEKIEIKKTNVELANERVVNLTWNSDNKTIKGNINVGSITDNDISSDTTKKIKISKTTLNIDETQFIANEFTNSSKLKLQNIYVKRIDDPDESGASKIVDNVNIYAKTSKDASLKLYTKDSTKKAEIKIGEKDDNSWGIYNTTDRFVLKRYGDGGEGNKILTTVSKSGALSIGNLDGVADEKLHVNGNIKLEGISNNPEIIMPGIKSNEPHILLANSKTNIAGNIGDSGYLKFTPVKLGSVGSDITVQPTGLITINAGSIGNDEIAEWNNEINTDDNRIDHTKIKLSFTWGGQRAGTVAEAINITPDGVVKIPDKTLEDGGVEDKHISNDPTKQIQISKTTLKINTNQFKQNVFNTNGTLEINDIYVKNNTGGGSDPINLEGSICVVPDTNRNLLLKIYSKSDDLHSGIHLGKDSTSKWHIYNEKATKKLIFNHGTETPIVLNGESGRISIGGDFPAEESIHIRDNIKIGGNIVLTDDKMTNGNVLLIRDNKVESTPISGVININKSGTTSFNSNVIDASHIVNGTITNQQISSSTQDKIDISKVDLLVDTTTIELGSDHKLRVKSGVFLTTGSNPDVNDITVDNLIIDSNSFVMQTNDVGNLLVGVGDKFENKQIHGDVGVSLNADNGNIEMNINAAKITDGMIKPKGTYNGVVYNGIDIQKTTLSVDGSTIIWNGDELKVANNVYLEKSGGSIKYLNVKNNRGSNSKLEIFSEINDSVLHFKNKNSEWLCNAKVDSNFSFTDGQGRLVYNIDSNRNISIGEKHNTSEKLFVKGNAKVDGSLEINSLRIPGISAGQSLMSNIDGQLVPTQFIGDVNIASDGTTTIQSRTIESSMINLDVIQDKHIRRVIQNDDTYKGINIKKTTLSVDNSTIEWINDVNGVENTLQVKDIYVLKSTDKQDAAISNLNLTGTFERNTNGEIIKAQELGNNLFFNLLRRGKKTSSSRFGYLDATNIFQFQNNEMQQSGNMAFKFNNSVEIPTLKITGMLTTDDDIKITGNKGIIYDTNVQNSILISDGTRFISKAPNNNSNISINSTNGLISINSETISSDMIKAKDVEGSGYKGIDLQKIDFNINTSNLSLDSDTNTLDIVSVFVRNDEANIFAENTTFSKNITVKNINSEKLIVDDDAELGIFKGGENGSYLTFKDGNNTTGATIGFSKTDGDKNKFQFSNNETGNTFEFNGTIETAGNINVAGNIIGSATSSLTCNEIIFPGTTKFGINRNLNGHFLVSDGSSFKPRDLTSSSDLKIKVIENGPDKGKIDVQVIAGKVSGFVVDNNSILNQQINSNANIALDKLNFNPNTTQFTKDNATGGFAIKSSWSNKLVNDKANVIYQE